MRGFEAVCDECLNGRPRAGEQSCGNAPNRRVPHRPWTSPDSAIVQLGVFS